MKLQKLPNELSVEELLKALEDTSKAEKKEITSPTLPNIENDSLNESYPVASFLDAFEIKNGNSLVSDAVLYKLFTIWNKTSGMNKSLFNRQMQLFLIPSLVKKGKVSKIYYRLNKSATNLVKYVNYYHKEKKRNQRTNKNYKKYYEKFFKDIGIEGGPLFVEADILYHIYDNYMYKRNRKSYSYHTFELVCSLFFEVKYFTDFTAPWFGVSENVKQHISKEAVENWRKGRKRRGLKTRKVKEENKQETLYPEIEED